MSTWLIFPWQSWSLLHLLLVSTANWEKLSSFMLTLLLVERNIEVCYLIFFNTTTYYIVLLHGRSVACDVSIAFTESSRVPRRLHVILTSILSLQIKRSNWERSTGVGAINQEMFFKMCLWKCNLSVIIWKSSKFSKRFFSNIFRRWISSRLTTSPIRYFPLSV